MTTASTQRAFAGSSRRWCCPICRTSHAQLLGNRDGPLSSSWPHMQASSLSSLAKGMKKKHVHERGAVNVRSRRQRWDALTKTAAYVISITVLLLQMWLLLGRVVPGFVFGVNRGGEHWAS